MKNGKKNEKKRDKNNVLLIIGLLLLVVIVGVGYAVLSSNLSINGTANIGTNTWNVHFANVQTTAGSVTPTTAPSASGTSTLNVTYAVNLNAPGDFYEFTIDVVNGGTLDAKLKSQTLSGAEDYDFIHYTVTKADGSAVPSNLVLNGGSGSNPGDSVKLKVRVEYDKNITDPSILSLDIGSLTLTYQMQFEQN